MSITSQPTDVSPAVTAAANIGPEVRASLPMTTDVPGPGPLRSSPHGARAEARAHWVNHVGDRSFPTMPRTPETPTIKVSVIADNLIRRG